MTHDASYIVGTGDVNAIIRGYYGAMDDGGTGGTDNTSYIIARPIYTRAAGQYHSAIGNRGVLVASPAMVPTF